MRVRKFLLVFLVPTMLGGALLVLPAIAGSEPTIEAANEKVYAGEHHHWVPPTATVTAGGSVKIANPSTVNHGVEWKSGPEPPGCAGVPVGSTPAASGANWSGSCKFTKPGKYEFWCTVHGAEMSAVVTVNPPPIPTIKKLSPKKGPATYAFDNFKITLSRSTRTPRSPRPPPPGRRGRST
jgi:plastocyanin